MISERIICRRGVYVFYVSLICLTLLLMPGLLGAECSPTEVWWTFPESNQLNGVSEQLRSDSGPTTDNKTQTVTFARYWQGATSLRSVSIGLIIYPTVKEAAAEVDNYGQGLLKSKSGLKVSLGDLGYRTDDIKRPYFKVHKGRFVLTYYTSYPGSRSQVIDVPAQEKIIRDMLAKVAGLSCFAGSSSSTPAPPVNTCPWVVSASLSSTTATPQDTVTFSGQAKDKEGNKISYTWEISDFSKKIIKTINGAQGSWKNPPLGNYRIRLVVKDQDPNCYDWRDLQLVVTDQPTVPNQAPVIRLSAAPANPTTDQDVVFTAVVSDPDGDSMRCGWGHQNTGNVTGGRYPQLQKKPGSNSLIQPRKTSNGNTFTWSGRIASGRQQMTFGAEDVRGAISSKTATVVVTDPAAVLTVTIKQQPTPQTGSIRLVQQTINFGAIDNAKNSTTLSYSWWIDGKKQSSWSGKNVSWSNPALGYHEIKVQIWKKNGETASDRVLVEIVTAPPAAPAANNPPRVSIVRLTQNPQVGQAVSFKATISDPDPQDKLTWEWFLDGKKVGWQGLQPSWPSATAGRHTVKLVVSDGSDSASKSLAFAVASLPPPPPPKSQNSLIKSADFYAKSDLVWAGKNRKSRWQAGEKVNLEVSFKSLAVDHQLTVIWKDPGGREAHRENFQVNAGGWSAPVVWSSFQSRQGDKPGRWTAEIMVDGRFDCARTFSLDSPGSRSGRRPAPVNSMPPTRPGTPPPSGGSGAAPPSGSGWKSAF